MKRDIDGVLGKWLRGAGNNPAPAPGPQRPVDRARHVAATRRISLGYAENVRSGCVLLRHPTATNMYKLNQYPTVRGLLGQEAAIGRIANATGLSRQTVYRIKDDPTSAEAALATWGM